MASEVLLGISRDEAEWARLMSEYKYEVDTQSKLVTAERKGHKEGRKEGLEEGQQAIIALLKSGKSPEEIIREYDK